MPGLNIGGCLYPLNKHEKYIKSALCFVTYGDFDEKEIVDKTALSGRKCILNESAENQLFLTLTLSLFRFSLFLWSSLVSLSTIVFVSPALLSVASISTASDSSILIRSPRVLYHFPFSKIYLKRTQSVNIYNI